MSKFVLTAQLQLQAPNNVGQVVNQIQRQLNNVNVKIEAQGAAAAEKQIKNVTSATNDAASAANRMGKAFAVSIKRFAAFSIATRAVGLLTTTLSDAVSEAIDFERQLLKVSQVTGKTMSQLKGLTGEINRLSTGLGVTSKSLLEVSRTLSQAGLSARDTRIALDSLAKTTLAPTFDDITQTAEGAVAVLAQFKQGAAALEKQLGAINAVAGQFAVEAGDLISVIRRTGGVFREAGGDLNELIGLFTSVRATTRESADSIATGLRTIFTRIQRPKTIEFLKQFGVELTGVDGKFVGAFEAVKRLSGALKGLEQGDIRFIKIAEQLGGFRQIGKVIPLLKEFRTAEEARQAAIAGGNSLTDDAAAAQATLAVQITKVQESFAKLMRDITETTTFQIIAKSALAFADSLIRIADAIKPLLPILAALAAFKLAKTFGQFGAGLSTGIKNLGANVQGANNGGRIQHFARGGMVPGTGNSDTVPAMLQPGEFVIKKSSVKGIGASRLASMNKGGVQKFKGGGEAQVILNLTPGEIGGFFLNPAGGEETKLGASSKVKTIEGRKGLDLLRNKADRFDSANPIGKDGAGLKGLSGKKLNELGLVSDAALAKGEKGMAVGRYNKLLTGTEFTKKDGKLLTTAEVNQAVKDSYKEGDLKDSKGLRVQAKGLVASFLPGLSEIKEDPTVSAEVAKRTKDGLGKMVKKATADVYTNVFKGEFSGGENIEATTAEAVRRIKTDDNAVNTTQGFVFEGLIEAMTGAKPGGGTSSFDFPKSSIKSKTDQLQAFFGGDSELQKLIKADAKKTLNNKNLDGIAGKTISDFSKGNTEGIDSALFNGKTTKFAKGGSVSDTVPAMLTPGEYVINRRSAQQIGYGALGKMNKHGAQGFAKGGAVGGVQYLKKGGPLDEFGSIDVGAGIPTVDAGGGGGVDLASLQADVEALAVEVKSIADIFTELYAPLEEFKKLLETGEGKETTPEDKKAASGKPQLKKGAMGPDNRPTERGLIVRNASTATPIEPEPNANRIESADAPSESRGMTNTGQIAKKGTPSKDMSGSSLTAELQKISKDLGAFAQMLKQVMNNLPQFKNAVGTASSTVTTGFAGIQNSNLALVNGNVQVAQATIQVDSGLGKVVKKLTDQSTATDKVVEQINEQVKTTEKVNKGKQKEQDGINKTTKAGVGATTMFFALQSILALLPTEIEKTDGIFKRVGKGAVKLALSAVALSFVLKQFTAEMTFATVASALKAKAEVKAAVVTSYTSQVQAAAYARLSAATTFAGTAMTNLGTKAALGFAALAAASYLVFKAFSDIAKQAKEDAIEAGNVSKAGAAAVAEAGYGAAAVFSVLIVAAIAAAIALNFMTAGTGLIVAAVLAVGAGLLGLLGWLTPLANIGRDVLAFFSLMSSTASIKLRAEADASAANATERLKDATEAVTEAFKEVSDGSRTATDALLNSAESERAFNAAGSSVTRGLKAQAQEEEGFFGTGPATDERGISARAAVIGQFIKERGTDAGVSEDTEAQLEDLGIDDAEIKAFKDNTQKIFDLISAEADLRARAAKEMIISNKGLTGTEGIDQTKFVAEQIARLGDSFDALSTEQQTQLQKDLNKEYENALKAVVDNIKQLNRFNFGLTETNGALAMASSKIDNLNMAFDSGAARIRSSINKLSTIIEDGATMDPAELQENLNAINKELSNFGVDPRSVDNITKQFKALNTVQSSFRIETEKLVTDLQTGEGGFGSAENFANKLKERLTTAATDGGADPEAVKQLIESLPELSGGDVEALRMGNTDVLAAGFQEVNDKLKATLETMAKIAALTEEVAKLNSDRLDSETALFAAQKTAIGLQLEGAQIQAKFGGKIVSSAVMRQSAIKTANVGTSRSGLSALQSGSVEEIRRRNQEIRGGVFGIQSRGRANVAGGGGFFGAGPKVTGAGFSSQGQATEAQGKALRQAQQEQISTIKSLIAAEEAHLKTIQEKNRLEKESLKSLLDGNVEDFLDKQAAVGATAAIASGDTRLQGIFGADALGGAFNNLEKQQAAGVTSLFGQQIGGAGGLLEQSSGAALSARGVTDPRTAALLAQTTAEEEISKGNIRDLAGELGATGEVGVGIAEQDLKTAEFKVAQATIVVQKAQQETQEKSKQAADIRATGQERANKILERSEKELVKIKLANEEAAREAARAAQILEDEQGNSSFNVFDNRADKIRKKILAGTLINNEADKRETQLQSGKFTGGKRKLGLGALNLASINQSIQGGRFASAANQAGKVGGFAQRATSVSNVVTKAGGAVRAGASGFNQALIKGAGFKEAFKTGLAKSGLLEKFTELTGAFKTTDLAKRLKDFAEPFKSGAGKARMFRKFGGLKTTSGVMGAKATSTMAIKGFREFLGAVGGSIKDATIGIKNLGKAGGSATGRILSEKTGRFGLNKLAGASEFTGRFGLDATKRGLGRASAAIAGSNVGKAFQLGKTGTKLGQKVAATGTRIGFSTTAAAAKGIEATGRGAATANLLGRTSNQLGKLTAPLKNIASQGGKKLLGKTLQGAGSIGGQVLKSLGKKIPAIGVAVSGILGTYEAIKGGGSGIGGFAAGALTGSAFAGDSIFTSGANLLGADIEKGGGLDKGLGVIGAGLYGAFSGAAIGTAFGGPVGTLVGGAIGAGLGVITEGIKIAIAPAEGIALNAAEVQAKLEESTGETNEALGISTGESGNIFSSSIESGVSGFGGLADQRDAILASTEQGASPIVAPASVQAAGGPAFVGPLPETATGVGTTGGLAAGGVDQAGLMQVMNVFSQNIGHFGIEMQKFNEGLAQNIKELKDLKFKIQLDGPTNVNVNFQNAGFLSQLTEGLKNELLKIVAQEMIPGIAHENGGDHKYTGNVLG